jgi:hypothetical protein
MTGADDQIMMVARYQLHEIIRAAYRHDLYARLLHLYNAGFRGRDLR